MSASGWPPEFGLQVVHHEAQVPCLHNTLFELALVLGGLPHVETVSFAGLALTLEDCLLPLKDVPLAFGEVVHNSTQSIE